MTNISLSVFFPCFNEKDNIQTLITTADNYLSGISNDYEIIIVDDGSSDGTYEEAIKLSETVPTLRVVQHEANRGYGAALRTGFDTAQKDFIFFTDGDNQFDISEISKFLPYIADYDIVAGFRIKRNDNLIRWLNSRSFQLLVQVLFGLQIKDMNCAFKIFKKHIIKESPLKSTGAMINAELLIRAMKKGASMKEIGVNHYPRQWGSQTGANITVIIRAFKELFSLRSELNQ
ncbi:MAG: glycosyltransferase family 2 protein [Nitrospira sp.]|nr:glycosyltransferase family 2 protein [Candidatus Brocadiales bacterium]MBL7050185.1 glycosyltransferase family 2 protein [Nitrospira sp.]